MNVLFVYIINKVYICMNIYWSFKYNYKKDFLMNVDKLNLL